MREMGKELFRRLAKDCIWVTNWGDSLEQRYQQEVLGTLPVLPLDNWVDGGTVS